MLVNYDHCKHVYAGKFFANLVRMTDMSSVRMLSYAPRSIEEMITDFNLVEYVKTVLI